MKGSRSARYAVKVGGGNGDSGGQGCKTYNRAASDWILGVSTVLGWSCDCGGGVA